MGSDKNPGERFNEVESLKVTLKLCIQSPETLFGDLIYWLVLKRFKHQKTFQVVESRQEKNSTQETFSGLECALEKIEDKIQKKYIYLRGPKLKPSN